MIDVFVVFVVYGVDLFFSDITILLTYVSER